MKRFASFSLDTANECICQGQVRCQLPPKAFAVLRYLVDNPGRIVTKQELLDAVWPDTFVQEAVLKVCILEVRKALGENSKEPKFIDTVHRRGYRFIAPVSDAGDSAIDVAVQTHTLPGREKDLACLNMLLQRTAAGQRQVAFVTGEAGIGKSTLVSHFLNGVAAAGSACIMRGHCIEHFGVSEAYEPVFNALAQAARHGSIPGVADVLRKFAPTWLAHMPGLASAADLSTLKQETLGAGRDRMLREISEAIETLAAEHPLVLVLEDLHWSDVSTLDLISSLASRNSTTRLLLIASYRPVDVILNNHPVKQVKQALLARGGCVEVELGLLNRDEVSGLLEMRFPKHIFPQRFARLVHARTDGNPLFIANMLEYALARSVIENVDGEWRATAEIGDFDLKAPESLTQMIEAQIERLSKDEQDVLEWASVAGMDFAVALIAGDDTANEARIEQRCDGLARRELFIRPAGLDDYGSGVSVRYRFTHALYRDVLYQQVSPGRRIGLHRGIGERMEVLFANRLGEVASELSRHFEECRDYERAIRYLRVVARKCATCHALPEGMEALNRALVLAEKLPDRLRESAQLELLEHTGLLYRLMGQLAQAADEFEKMYKRAHQAGDLEAELRAQLWLASVSSWLDRGRCLAAVHTAAKLCGSPLDSDLRANALGQAAYFNLLFTGWDERDFAASAAALDTARSSRDRVAIALHASRHPFFLALCSRYREASRTAEEGVRTAVEIESLIDYSVSHFFDAWALLHVGEWGRMRRLLRSAVELANKNGHEWWVLLFSLLEAFLFLQTFQFDAARLSCVDYLHRARKLGHELSIQMSLVLLGMAELGAGDLKAAGARFEEISDWQSRQRILMDWIWKLPLQLGLTELYVAQGDLKRARSEAEVFQRITAATAERTWSGLAHWAAATISCAERDDERARREISKGLAIVEGHEAPLASWRLHALAAQLEHQEYHSAKARAVVSELAESLSSDDELRASFLASGSVSTLFAGPLSRAVTPNH